MQEKDIREKLNQELDEMAPDILNKILAQPIEPVKSEKELFGKNKPLFKEKKKMGNYFWAPAMTAVAACILIAVMLFKPWAVSPTAQANTAFSIIIDVNPSISIRVNKDGTVDKVEAGNKDAKEIVEKVNKKIDKNTTYNKAVKLTIKQLDKQGYLKKEKNAMLLSVVSDDKEAVKDTVKEIKNTAKAYKEEKKIKCTTVYQNCEVDEKVKKVAEKNNVSVGKAAFCLKIAEKEKVDVDNMCKKNIYTLIKEAEEKGAVIYDLDIMNDFSEDVMTGSLFDESESISGESESITEESESLSVEETSTVEESQTVEVASDNQPEQEGTTVSNEIIN